MFQLQTPQDPNWFFSNCTILPPEFKQTRPAFCDIPGFNTISTTNSGGFHYTTAGNFNTTFGPVKASSLDLLAGVLEVSTSCQIQVTIWTNSGSEHTSSQIVSQSAVLTISLDGCDAHDSPVCYLFFTQLGCQISATNPFFVGGAYLSVTSANSSFMPCGEAITFGPSSSSWELFSTNGSNQKGSCSPSQFEPPNFTSAQAGAFATLPFNGTAIVITGNLTLSQFSIILDGSIIATLPQYPSTTSTTHSDTLFFMNGFDPVDEHNLTIVNQVGILQLNSFVIIGSLPRANKTDSDPGDVVNTNSSSSPPQSNVSISFLGGSPTGSSVIGSPSHKSNASHGASMGVITGSVIGSVTGLLAITLLAFLIRRSRRQRRLVELTSVRDRLEVPSHRLRRPGKQTFRSEKVDSEPAENHEDTAGGGSGARAAGSEMQPAIRPLSIVSNGRSDGSALADETNTPVSGVSQAMEGGDASTRARLHDMERTLNTIAARLALGTYEAPPSYVSQSGG